MLSFVEALNAYIRNHPFDSGNSDGETVMDQLYRAYTETHESTPPEISDGFRELERFLESPPLNDNTAYDWMIRDVIPVCGGHLLVFHSKSMLQ